MNVKFLILLRILAAATQGIPVVQQRTSSCKNTDIFLHTYKIPEPEIHLANTRVSGGIPVKDSLPHMVALTLGFGVRVLMCAGSLVSYRAVLTAAHCVCPAIVGEDHDISRDFYGVMGTNNWRSFGQSYTFSHYFTHPHYDADSVSNDIALLITTTDVMTSPKVNVIPISFDAVGAGALVKSAGWGRTAVSGSLSSTLREFTTYTTDSSTCLHEAIRAAEKTKIKWPQMKLRSAICTLHKAGYSICQGDSGSALVKRSTGRQVGIVSWGFPCTVNGPDTHLRLSEYRQWIIEHLV